MDIARLKTPVTEIELAKIVDAAGDAESQDILRRMAFQLSSSRSPGCSAPEAYAARCDEPGHILVKMPGMEYGLALDEAEKLKRELAKAMGVSRKLLGRT